MANETENSNKNKGQIDLSGKVALITGSTSGFGAAIAILLSKYGAKVVVTGRNEQKVAQVGRDCNKVSPNGSKALLIVADVTHDDYCKWLVDKTIEKFGKIDILVNNAGAGAITSISDPKLMDTFDDVMRLDLRSVVYLTHRAVPYLEETKGTIINISSVASIKPYPIFLPYCMAKSALDMFTKCLALELGPKGIRVNSINPTATRTNFQTALGADQEIINQILAHVEETTPLRRIGETIDVANAVAFLASNDSSFITGINLVADGGAN